MSKGSLAPWVVVVGTVDPADLRSPETEAYAFLHAAFVSQGLLYSSDLDPILQLEHLPGTPLYMGSTLAGTAHCQSSMFATMEMGEAAHALPEPKGYTGPCWNTHGDLGRVLGDPAYIEAGTVSPPTDDTIARVTPWTAAGWGPTCQLTIELTYELQSSKQFCGGDPAVCAAAGAIAVDVARDYFAYRRQATPSMKSIDTNQQVPDFKYPDGAADNAGDVAVVTQAWRLLAHRTQVQFPGISPSYAMSVSNFPTFGYRAANGGWEFSFSYVNFAMFPLMLNDRLYLGAVGHNGVGWREGSHILIAVYEAPKAEESNLVPLAGFIIDPMSTGLKKTVVEAFPPQ